MQLAEVELPEGWTWEAYPGRGETAVISAQTAGWVSIDFASRRFQLGYTAWCRSPDSRPIYAGRGWRQKLVRDAVEHLRQGLVRVGRDAVQNREPIGSLFVWVPACQNVRPGWWMSTLTIEQNRECFPKDEGVSHCSSMSVVAYICNY